MPASGDQRTSNGEGGRVNQKRRTRAAIVAAAQELLDEGATPTVAQAAERALVSRTTAYRYFPTQDSLMMELSVTVDVPEIEELVARPVDADGAEARVREVIDLMNRHVLDDEVLYRTALRLYLDMWLSLRDEGDPTVRAGRRTRWLSSSLAPLRAAVPADVMRRLEAALSLVMGIEAITVLRDVCRLSRDEALDVTRWATEALLAAALHAEPAPNVRSR
jgi:AcrR family transcriptional regulator